MPENGYSPVVKIRNTSEEVLDPNTSLAITLTVALQALVSIIAMVSIVALILPPLCFLYY